MLTDPTNLYVGITFTFKLLSIKVRVEGIGGCVRCIPSLLYLIHRWSTIVELYHSDSSSAPLTETRAPGQLI